MLGRHGADGVGLYNAAVTKRLHVHDRARPARWSHEKLAPASPVIAPLPCLRPTPH